jgi:toxin ParE1/3/4
MAEIEISRRADADLEGIFVFSIERFGERVATQHRSDLQACLLRLAEDPTLGRPLAGRTRTFFRLTCRRHITCFSRDRESDKVLIVRVLHASMELKDHLP